MIRKTGSSARTIALVVALAVVVLAVQVIGKLRREMELDSETEGVAFAAVPEVPVKPLSESERAKLLELSDLMMQGIAEGDLGVFREAFWIEKFIDRCLGSIRIREDERQAFTAGVRRAVLSSEHLSRSWSGWEFRRVRYYEEQGHPRILVRVTGDNVGLNYMVWHATKDDSGNLRFCDYYSFSAGESLTDIGRRFCAMAFRKANASVSRRLLGTKESLLSHFPAFQQMGEAVLDGEPQRAIALYRSLPKELQDEKVVLLLFLRALSDAERTDDYVVNVERFQRLYPGDESLALLLIDYYTAKNDVEKVIEAIDSLSKRVNGDSYLDILRGHVCLTHSLYGRAERFVRRAIQADPQEEIAYWTLVNVGLTSKRYEIVSECIEAMTTRFDYEFSLESLARSRDYADYARSAEAKRYFGERDAKAKKVESEPEEKAPTPKYPSEPAPILEDF